MCTEQDIIDAVQQALWHNAPDHIHSRVDASGPHASIGSIDVEVDLLNAPEISADDEDGTFLDANGGFTGTAHISLEGSYGDVPSRIAFSGRCVDGKVEDLEFDWMEDEPDTSSF